MRKPVGIVCDGENRLIVVCDDGTVWVRAAEFKDARAMWTSMDPPIPGSEGATGGR